MICVVPFPAFFREILALPAEGSTVANEVDWLHLLVISVTMLGAAGVAVVALLLVIRYRRRGSRKLTPHVVMTPSYELLVAGSLLTLFIGFWVLGYYVYLDIVEPPGGEDELVVYVMAKQWMWKFSYPNGRDTNGILVVPEGRNVKLVMTSRDVIHSFYVPAFRIKQDVLPGRYTVAWFQANGPATYQVLCAEYCGLAHSLMRADVVVLEKGEYGNWLDTNTPVGSEDKGNLVRYGRDVAVRYECLACHSIGGQRLLGPTWSRLYGSWVELEGGQRVKADDAYLTESMMQPEAKIVRGYGPVMPNYFGRLSHTDVAALVEFIKSLKDGPETSP